MKAVMLKPININVTATIAKGFAKSMYFGTNAIEIISSQQPMFVKINHLNKMKYKMKIIDIANIFFVLLFETKLNK